MKLSSLRNFLVITSCGSFTRAAEQLLISQPTLSRQIKELEQELGVSLYERNKEGLQLSEAGEIVMEEAADIIERCDRLYALFRPAEENGKKVPEILRIGIQRLFDMNDLWMAVNKLQEENSETEIELIEADRHQLEQGILNNRFDVVISLQDYHENYSGLKVLPYRENTVKVAVPAGHPLTEKEILSLPFLKAEQFVRSCQLAKHHSGLSPDGQSLELYLAQSRFEEMVRQYNGNDWNKKNTISEFAESLTSQFRERTEMWGLSRNEVIQAYELCYEFITLMADEASCEGHESLMMIEGLDSCCDVDAKVRAGRSTRSRQRRSLQGEGTPSEQ